MTFYRGLCDDVFDTLGRDDTLRHAYRVYLWRRAVSLLRNSPTDIGPTAGGELHSEIQAFLWSKRASVLDTERAQRM
jgi:hypothetical protein